LEDCHLTEKQIGAFLQGLKNRQKIHNVLSGMAVDSLQKCIDELAFIYESKKLTSCADNALMG